MTHFQQCPLLIIKKRVQILVLFLYFTASLVSGWWLCALTNSLYVTNNRSAAVFLDVTFPFEAPLLFVTSSRRLSLTTRLIVTPVIILCQVYP